MSSFYSKTSRRLSKVSQGRGWGRGARGSRRGASAPQRSTKGHGKATKHLPPPTTGGYFQFL